MGRSGILLVSEGAEYLAVPPNVDVQSTIGAGDSSVAGFVSGMVQGRNLKECLVYATAAGTATTLHHGTALAQKEDFDKLVPQVRLTVISERSSEKAQLCEGKRA
jgi:fructose-1-phosphate kinase PfkB-like protein